MNFALSTSFIDSRQIDARRLLKYLEQLDIRGVELDYRLEAKLFHVLKPLLKQARIKVTSLHNYCPFPQLIPKVRPSGDYFRLSALDKEERRLAVAWTLKTMEQAHDLEAGAVVLHCGGVQMDAQREAVYQCYAVQGASSDALCKLMDAELEQRSMRLGPYMDALLFSIEKLLPAAERFQVTLGLENRYHYDELPGYEEMALLLQEFKGGPVGYWHDCGHGHIQECLGLPSQYQWLQRFGDRLVGAHLHDAKGLDDHRPPGSGEIDLTTVLTKLDDARPMVVEVAPGTALDKIEKGIEFLRNLVSSTLTTPDKKSDQVFRKDSIEP